MSKERLKQADDWIKSMYDLLSLKTDEEDRAYTQNKIDLFKWMKEQAERADMLAHENMNIRKGYQERSKQVQELERVNKQLKNNLSVYKGYYKNMIKINEDIVEENKKYRNLIKDMGREIEVLTDVMSNADNADELNEEMIRLKGELENER